MVYVGASPVIIQAMLGGQAFVGAGGGPPLVTNVLQGGDIVQVATMVPYAIQSLIVETGYQNAKLNYTGKRIGISRLGAIPHFTLQAIVKMHNIQGINIVQTGTTTQGDHEFIPRIGRRHNHLSAVHFSLDERRISRIGRPERI